jgi:hypothetical protein
VFKKHNTAQINNQIFLDTFKNPSNKEPSTNWATPLYCGLREVCLPGFTFLSPKLQIGYIYTVFIATYPPLPNRRMKP